MVMCGDVLEKKLEKADDDDDGWGNVLFFTLFLLTSPQRHTSSQLFIKCISCFVYKKGFIVCIHCFFKTLMTKQLAT